jgi:hypothetical protein
MGVGWAVPVWRSAASRSASVDAAITSGLKTLRR